MKNYAHHTLRCLLLSFLMSLLLPVGAQTFRGKRTDFRDETIYFLLPTRFYDGDPQNNTQCWDNGERNAGDPAWRGDFKGLIEKLDYIKALGFTAIWITPVVQNASGYDYHGYYIEGIYDHTVTNTSDISELNGDTTSETTTWYDLSGRKLNGKPTKKGIYINNERKYIVK